MQRQLRAAPATPQRLARGFYASEIRQIAEIEMCRGVRASQVWGGPLMKRSVLVAFAILALAPGLVGAIAPAVAAQEQVVRIDGRVQWIGGGQMVVQADKGPSVGIDLTSVPQDEYAGLNVRDRVAVFGMISPDGRHVIGTSILRSAQAR